MFHFSNVHGQLPLYREKGSPDPPYPNYKPQPAEPYPKGYDKDTTSSRQLPTGYTTKPSGQQPISENSGRFCLFETSRQVPCRVAVQKMIQQTVYYYCGQLYKKICSGMK